MGTNTIFNKVKVPVSFILIVAILNLSIGCSYFKVRTIDELTADLSKEQLQTYQNLNKYIILHTTDYIYHITIVSLDSDKNLMECKVMSLDNNHKLYTSPDDAGYRYKRRSESGVLNEVHLFTNAYVKPDQNEKISLPVNSLTRMDIIEPDYGRTIASHVFGTVGVTAAVIGLVYIIILLTKSSCPFVYVKDGVSYNFVGEIFGGAIFKPLQRDDFVKLREVHHGEKSITIKISNELKEIQYTDLARLILVDYPANRTTAMDSRGQAYVTGEAVFPISAVLNNQKQQTAAVSEIDNSYCLFDSETEQHYKNELILNFRKPSGIHSGRLLLNVKNSWWLDFAFTRFTELFGSYYPTYVEKQRSANRDSLLKWSNQNELPLSVYLKSKGVWKLVEQIPTIGPLAARQVCVPLELTEAIGNEVEVKLSCGFLTWELDAASLDYTNQEELHAVELAPFSAIDQDHIDMSSLLKESDQRYLIQPLPGQECTITYQLPLLNSDRKYDVYLHSSGYYEHVRDYKGIPDKELLLGFKKPGAFNDFMHLLFEKVSAAQQVEQVSVR